MQQDTQIEFLRLGLILGVIDTQQVVTWADAQIMEANVTHDAIWDLSLGADKTERKLADAIAAHGIGADAAATNAMLGYLYRRLDAAGFDLASTRGVFEGVYGGVTALGPALRERFNDIVKAIDAAAPGSEGAVRDQARALLAPYVEYDVDLPV